ncbi:2-succinyl-5-enolpyruvyl-6-hydroxy-3-cyclohexene-1-carboxylic-acid synthase [Bacteroidetes bacterium endosymbiont of Geopemphigus sp.]|uniref:2-succinyl-5-enolpyruvyl-6-hydroxy-3- cyclohexene-1-carboxylic-acid synthase n=1 Tax=Bacteroidetes bacterium endosymbiont of Geopemphigus sp. TaxID=2047937 RepID=UPI000CD03195|nr:2-succinyl-5-enolpyruvyl-6-hydroxy-3-cyclohexene-1-carboxylic-acid synthase [Bacteroidetes bacterium endosymbiont of Geopemphigus sp.]
MFSAHPVVQGIAEILKAKDITYAVLSPGSRNAPVIIHLTGDPAFKTYSIADERSAGFFALGMAQQLQVPVVLNCTSGSALVNYYPSLVEAYYQQIPLILLTADRPKESIDLREGQTIQQENLFGRHVVKFVQLTEDHSKKGLWYNDYLVNETLNAALLLKKPVHINLPLSEPLYNRVNKIKRKPKIITVPSLGVFVDPSLLKPYQEIWKNNPKKMILIGQQNSSPDLEIILEDLSQNDPSLIILTETLSNIHGVGFIECIDRLIYSVSKEKEADLYPELLITFGKSIVSKKIKNFLRDAASKHHWHIEENAGPMPDTYHALTTYWGLPAEVFLKNLPKTCLNSDFRKKWTDLDKERAQKHKVFLSKTRFCDLKAFEIILQAIPEGSLLHLGNGTAIRYQQLFKRKKSVISYANRGTAGIDGCVSTAMGAAVACQKPLVLVTGDLSFFYDSNALWNSYTPEDFRIIIINNGGGDIFRFIPGPDQSAALEDYFVKTHSLNAKSLCEMHHWSYLYADTEITLRNALKKFWKPTEYKLQANLLEVNTRKYNNSHQLRNYFSSLHKKIKM